MAILPGAIVGAALVLLVLVSELASGFLWRDSGNTPRFYCPSCDLRYTHFEVHGGMVHFCPHGHATIIAAGFNWTTALITACVTFIVCETVTLSIGFLR